MYLRVFLYSSAFSFCPKFVRNTRSGYRTRLRVMRRKKKERNNCRLHHMICQLKVGIKIHQLPPRKRRKTAQTIPLPSFVAWKSVYSEMQEKLYEQMSVSTDPRVAERRQWAQWFGAAIPEIHDSLWSEFQTESLQLVNSFKARSRRVQAAATQPVQHDHSVYVTARRLQTLNYSSSPGGYLPIWQQQYQLYQSPHHPMIPPSLATIGRSHSAPLTTTATFATAFSVTSSATNTAVPTHGTVQSTHVNRGGQLDSLQELINYSGISDVDASCDSDVVSV